MKDRSYGGHVRYAGQIYWWGKDPTLPLMGGGNIEEIRPHPIFHTLKFGIAAFILYIFLWTQL
jgi:hypothetical protein